MITHKALYNLHIKHFITLKKPRYWK